MAGLAGGAVDYISKPFFKIEELGFKIQSLLALLKNRDNAVRQEILEKVKKTVIHREKIDYDQPFDYGKILKSMGLTDREIVILEYLKKGLQNKEISAELNLSVRTIDSHLYNIYRKTGCQNRMELLNKLFG